MNKRLLSLITVAVVLAGCAVPKKYERSQAPVPAAWPANVVTNSVTATNTLPAAAIGWREFFADPRLQRLVGLALTNNRDLQVTVLKVEQARAQYKIQRAGQLPQIDANASGSFQRIPAGVSGFGQPLTLREYSVNVGVASYELDLFGRVRSLKQQALEQYLASDEARRSASLSLVAEVAVQYLTGRELDEQLAVTLQTLATVQASYQLMKRQYEVGTVSEIDLRSAEAQVQTARGNVANLEQLRAQSDNALVFLIGQPLPADLPPAKSLNGQGLMTDLPVGLPSDLLQRRPDILAAEHQLKAADANILAVRAAFFPTITLTGAAGSSSVKLMDLFQGGSQAWNFSPQIKLPIFTGGASQANYDVAKLGQRIEIATYEKAVQSAFREVADALAARARLVERITAQEMLEKAQQRRLELADVRYRNGINSYLDVLLARQDLYAAQQTLIELKFARLSNAISLYKALGGGWQEHSGKAEAAPAAKP